MTDNMPSIPVQQVPDALNRHLDSDALRDLCTPLGKARSGDILALSLLVDGDDLDTIGVHEDPRAIVKTGEKLEILDLPDLILHPDVKRDALRAFIQYHRLTNFATTAIEAMHKHRGNMLHEPQFYLHITPIGAISVLTNVKSHRYDKDEVGSEADWAATLVQIFVPKSNSSHESIERFSHADDLQCLLKALTYDSPTELKDVSGYPLDTSPIQEIAGPG